MKRIYKIALFVIPILSCFFSCKQTTTAQNTQERSLTSDFETYWYQGNAEISTYKLSENRYGELRNGTATLIYVTENFVPNKQVKADRPNPQNIPVLKLNSVKKFNTGVYPYSIIQSVFTPLNTNKHAIKIATSVQEWCGHTYVQLNNKKDFEISAFSYFESEGDQKISLPKVYTENELWSIIRVEGLKGLPKGELDILPSFEFSRLNHKKIKNHKAKIEHNTVQGIVNYSILYPDLNRKLTISFQEKSPYIIESWSDQIGNKQASTATRITTKKMPYWQQNSNKHESLRDELGL